MWGGQHPMMPPPYGIPVPHPALYPPGGVYAQPTIGKAINTTTGVEVEAKNAEMEDQTSGEKSKENSDMRDEQGAGTENGALGSENEGASQSTESGSEGSSDASDDNHSQQELGANKKGKFYQLLASVSNGVNAKHVTSMPATNLNMGMDLWNASPAGAAKLEPRTSVSSASVPGMVGHPNHQWINNEREVKRQKRKQSNRESARRSRLRKQAECEELQRRVELLNSENNSLREELERLSTECMNLSSENESIKVELTQVCGPSMESILREQNPSD